MGKAKRTLGVIMAALMLVVTCMTYVPASAAVVLPTVKFVGLQNNPAVVGVEQTLFLTSNYDGDVQYQVFYFQRNNPTVKAVEGWKQVGSGWTTAADAKIPVELKVPAGTITVANNYSFAVRVKRAGQTGTQSNPYGDYDNAYLFNYVFSATESAALKDAKLASAEVAIGEKFVISGLTAGNSYRLFTLNEARTDRWDKAPVAASTTNTVDWAPAVAGNYVLDLQLVDASGKVTAWKLFNVKVVDKFAVASVTQDNLKEIKVAFNADALMYTDDTDTTGIWAASALNTANYAVTGKTVTEVEKLDSKTVLLTLDTAVAANSTVAITVKNTIKNAAQAKTVDTYALAYIANDTKTPTATASVDVLKKVTVNFSEPMLDKGIAYINGTQTAMTADGDKSEYATLGAAYEAGKSYTLTIVGAKDLNGNYIAPNPYTLTITLSSDTTKPDVVKVEPTAAVDNLQVTFTEALLDQDATAALDYGTVTIKDIAGTTLATPKLTAVVADTDSKTYTAALPVTILNGLDYRYINVVVSAYKDLSGNAGDAKTYRVLLQKDITAPAYKEYKLNTARTAIWVYTTETVTVAGGATVSVSYTNNDGIVYPAQTALPLTAVDSDKAVAVAPTNWVNTDGTLKLGTYTITFDAGDIVDKSAQLNENKAFTVTAVVGASTSTTDKDAPVITTPALFPNAPNTNLVELTSDEDLVLPTVADFKLDGGNLPTGSKVYFYQTKKVVRVELPDNSITLNGYRVLSYSLKDAANNVAKADLALNLVENVKPQVASAVLADPKHIVLTLTEKVDETALNACLNDFEVYVAGVKVDAAKVAATLTNDTTVTITLTDAVDISSVIKVKVVGTHLIDESLNDNVIVSGVEYTVTR